MRIAILGYGNLGRGAELSAIQQPDMTLAAIFTHRDPAIIIPQSDVPVYSCSELDRHQDEFDVLLLCGGSASHLPEATPELAARFDLADSYDNHTRIPEHFFRTDAAARKGGHVSLICCGWDPGLLSLCRLYAAAALPCGQSATFWGPGVSQGHTEALRNLPGVRDAVQFTVPDASVRKSHRRECFVVPEDGADRDALTREIKSMPHYFAGYETCVSYVSEEALREKKNSFAHSGRFVRDGSTGADHRHTIECRLRMDSNPEFTGSILLACARAVYRMRLRGITGCKTLFDVPPTFLSPLSPKKLREELL